MNPLWFKPKGLPFSTCILLGITKRLMKVLPHGTNSLSIMNFISLLLDERVPPVCDIDFFCKGNNLR